MVLWKLNLDPFYIAIFSFLSSSFPPFISYFTLNLLLNLSSLSYHSIRWSSSSANYTPYWVFWLSFMIDQLVKRFVIFYFEHIVMSPELLLMQWLCVCFYQAFLLTSNSPKIVSALISQFGIFTPCEYCESEFQIHRPEMHLFFSKEIFKNSEPKTKTDFFMISQAKSVNFFWVFISCMGPPSNAQALNRNLSSFKGPKANPRSFS